MGGFRITPEAEAEVYGIWLYYRIETEEMLILHVMRGQRDIEDLLHH